MSFSKQTRSEEPAKQDSRINTDCPSSVRRSSVPNSTLVGGWRIATGSRCDRYSRFDAFCVPAGVAARLNLVQFAQSPSPNLIAPSKVRWRQGDYRPFCLLRSARKTHGGRDGKRRDCRDPSIADCVPHSPWTFSGAPTYIQGIWRNDCNPTFGLMGPFASAYDGIKPAANMPAPTSNGTEFHGNSG
jgi:hypothetical protein